MVFDASASSDPDGQVVRYDWDLDGNGSFETPGGAVAMVRKSFPNALDLRPSVRVTDNEGGQGVASVLVHVVAPAVVSPVTPVSPADPGAARVRGRGTGPASRGGGGATAAAARRVPRRPRAPRAPRGPSAKGGGRARRAAPAPARRRRGRRRRRGGARGGAAGVPRRPEPAPRSSAPRPSGAPG